MQPNKATGLMRSQLYLWATSFTLNTRIHFLPTQAETADPQQLPTSNTKIHTTAKHTQLFFTSTVWAVRYCLSLLPINSCKEQFLYRKHRAFPCLPQNNKVTCFHTTEVLAVKSLLLQPCQLCALGFTFLFRGCLKDKRLQ